MRARGADEGIVERDVVERARRGDREAFAVLADASIARLYNLGQLMLGDPDLADDAVQEALIAAWRDLRTLRDPDRFTPWLLRILVRCVYRAAKQERRQGSLRLLSRGDDDRTPDTNRGFEDRDAIDRGFRRLTAEYRSVLVVHHYLGLPDDEAADVLGIPAGTFKSRLHRATVAMRAELEADSRAGEPLLAGGS
jgi:RNA polymerase sigma-70 factor (ECF subfamily)